MSQEMNTINETLLEKIRELKDIVWMVNCKLKSVRAAVELEKSYSETLAAWTSKINLCQNNREKVEDLWIHSTHHEDN